jgi:hypothetical protein
VNLPEDTTNSSLLDVVDLHVSFPVSRHFTSQNINNNFKQQNKHHLCQLQLRSKNTRRELKCLLLNALHLQNFCQSQPLPPPPAEHYMTANCDAEKTLSMLETSGRQVKRKSQPYASRVKGWNIHSLCKSIYFTA